MKTKRKVGSEDLRLYLIAISNGRLVPSFKFEVKISDEVFDLCQPFDTSAKLIENPPKVASGTKTIIFLDKAAFWSVPLGLRYVNLSEFTKTLYSAASTCRRDADRWEIIPTHLVTHKLKIITQGGTNHETQHVITIYWLTENQQEEIKKELCIGKLPEM